MASSRGGRGKGGVGKLSTKFQGVSLQLDEPEYQPPAKALIPSSSSKLLWDAKSKSGSFAAPFKTLVERKKNCGTLGSPVRLYTNHFNIKLDKIETIFLYNVVFKIEGRKSEFGRKDYPMLYRAFEELKSMSRGVFGDPTKSVLDAPKNIYSAMQFNLKLKSEFEVTIPEVSDIQELSVTFNVSIKPTIMIPVIDGVRDFIFDQLGHVSQPTDVNSCLNIVLGYNSRVQKGFDTIGRSIFTPQRGIHELANGKAVWFGTFCSTRMGWEIRLNVDMVCKPAYNEDSLVAFACKFCGCQDSNLVQNLKDDRTLTALSKELAGLKVRFKRPDNHVRDSKVIKIMPGNAINTMFNNVEGASGRPVKVSVFDFFKEAYKCTLKRPDLPVVHVGSKQKTIYWPMELLSLKNQSCPVSKTMTVSQAEQIIRVSSKYPLDRKLTIENGLHSLSNCFKTDKYANSFGLEIDGKMLSINGRVLPSPKLSYPVNGQDREMVPDKGRWKLGPGFQFNTSKPLAHWGILNFTNLDDTVIRAFIERLKQDGNLYGLKISPPVSVMRLRYHELSQKFEEMFARIKKTCTKPDLIMVILGEKDNSVYGNVKHYGEVVHRIPTQVVQKKSVLKIDVTLTHNICLKINAKLGGTNQRIARSNCPPVLLKPVMFIGADVTHATGQDMKPSIAAVVGSMDARASIYHCLVSVQERGTGRSEERILKMEDMVKELLKKFYEVNNGRKPEKIIFYRDGVSEGQFEEVMNCEISAIQRACKSIQADAYEPGITFVVVQKRHHTRFFPAEAGRSVKSGNVLPGTVVDQEIVHPRQQSFYLASHEGIQGTTKPSHYNLLFDDNNFSANELQELTFYLCHLYSRCERSVSYPAPTYYAHLSAFRARHHHNVLLQNQLANDQTEIKQLENLNIPNYFL